MNICIVYKNIIPVYAYGGIQRIIWWLGKALVRRGHHVTYLVGKGSSCDFARVQVYQPDVDLDDQIPEDIDVVHLYVEPSSALKKPYLFNMQSNTFPTKSYDINTVFVSKDHAQRHHAEAYVYNGIDPDDYQGLNLKGRKEYFHFLAKAAWKVKNLKGAIEITRKSHQKLHVVGGHRLNFKMGFRFTPDLHVRFHGMLGGEKKNEVLRNSKGLIFPVVWYEPFGIAIIESMYYGSPVFGTPYGSLPEIVSDEVGFLSAKKDELIARLSAPLNYDPIRCHERVMDLFSIQQMADSYLKLYEKVLNGYSLNAQKPHHLFDPHEKALPFY